MSAIRETPPTRTGVGNYAITNYPPVSCWKPEYIPKLFHRLSMPPHPQSLGLHVHLPFCGQQCHYCDLGVLCQCTARDVELYIDCLRRELRIYELYPAIESRAFNSAFFGGGSPSYLTADQIRQLFGSLQDFIPWSDISECTFKCEPTTVTSDKLKVLREYGVTFLTIGFPTLSNGILRRSGRHVVVEDCYRAFLQSREAGFNKINIDLLAGLAGETLTTWSYTIDRVLELAPDSVTIQQMELACNSRLHASIKAGHRLLLPSWPEKREMMRTAFEMLEKAGYTIVNGYTAVRHLEKTHYSCPLENFWHGTDRLALGQSASGLIRGVHYQNVDRFEDYIGALNQGRLPLSRALQMTPNERLRREVILLLKTGCIDRNYFRKKYRVELLDCFEEEFQALLEHGMVEVDGDKISLTRGALLQVDWLSRAFYSPEHASHAKYGCAC